MSDVKDLFQQLIEHLSGHFAEKKQRLVNKKNLLQLLFDRYESGVYGNMSDLIKAYVSKNKIVKSNQLSQAIRKALSDLSLWIDRYNEEFPHTIKFIIADRANLKIVSEDDFTGCSLEALSTEVAKVTNTLNELTLEMDQIIRGKKTSREQSKCRSLNKQVRRLSDRLEQLFSAISRLC